MSELPLAQKAHVAYSIWNARGMQVGKFLLARMLFSSVLPSYKALLVSAS